MNAATHTPTPWTADDGDGTYFGIFADGEPLAYLCESHRLYGEIALPMDGHGETRWDEHRANAAHIVRCVNSHDALVEALRDCEEFLRDEHGDGPTLRKAREALRAAGETP